MNLGPDSVRRYVLEPIPPITSVPSLLSREIGDKIRDVSHLRLDLGIRYVPEAIAPPASVPSPSLPEIEIEIVPLLLETLLPISDGESRPEGKVRRKSTREVTPP